MSALGYSLDAGVGRGAVSFRFDACTQEPRSWREEVYAAARRIAAEADGKPLWVCSSGGIDSEIVCRAFFDQGIHFSVLTLEYDGAANQHDIRYAIEWCAARNIVHKRVPLDMQEFLTTGIDRYMERYPAFHPFRYLQIRLMELVDEMGGYAVLGGGEQLYYVDSRKTTLTRDDTYIILATGNVAPLEWQKHMHTRHEPYFYFSTPELCLSFLRTPLVSFVLDNPDPVLRHKVNTYTLKKMVVLSYWPDIRSRMKFTGFEHIAPLVDAAAQRMKGHFKERFQIHRFPTPLLERQLSGRA